MMLAVRHHPEVVTPELRAYLRPHVRYDAEGLASVFLVEDSWPLPEQLAAVARAVCPGVAFRAVTLRGYRDGGAATPCHSDRGATGFCMILSLGATRTFRVHRVPWPVVSTAGCGDRGLDAIEIQCPEGTAVLTEEGFHDHWHHQLAPDPDVRGERLSLVFRTQPTGR